ncbi:hypothetical protein D9758_018540 [Tetrapyrgos nigripes]|uniref:t-SNARE coiled-coil homology domain-containing protein n=1 Tax=Tetrapyrgos nigripes TaxID=182062 RepID=A0A8H5B027_9AGAR|nr:hypothetical protein D9758_018540 [Tetrapyrgos nigripes]
MPLWKANNNKSMIPPVEAPSSGGSGRFGGGGGLPSGPASSRAASNKSSGSTYVPSRDGDLYQNNNYYNYSRYGDEDQGQDQGGYGGGGYQDKYSRSRGVGDVYTRGGTDTTVEQDRNELFSGYNPNSSGRAGGSGRFFDGPPGPGAGRPEPKEGEETEEDVEGIKTQMRFVKNESVNSTRNALRMAREAEETARGTLGRLGDQSERLANTEMHLDMAKLHAAQASDKTDELKKLNRSIFRPAITFNKDGKRRAQEQKIQSRYDEQKSEREKAMLQVRETQDRVGRAQGYARGGYGGEDDNDLMGGGGEEGLSGRRFKTQEQRQASRAATLVIDSMLLLQTMSSKMRLMIIWTRLAECKDDGIAGKVDNVDNKLFNVTSRQKRVK